MASTGKGPGGDMAHIWPQEVGGSGVGSENILDGLGGRPGSRSLVQVVRVAGGQNGERRKHRGWDGGRFEGGRECDG